MTTKHYFLVLLIMVIFGSAYPVGKLILNSSLPPMLMASIRMGIVFICLIPFWKFKIPEKKYFIPLFGFSLSMGTGVFLFMNLALLEATIVSPIIIGAQLSIPFAILISSFFLGEKISYKKWSLVFFAFVGIFLIGYDPNLKGEILALFYTTIMALCYALAQVFSRYLKDLDVKLTNTFMGITGCLSLLIFSIIFEGNSIYHFQNINFSTWLLILHSAVLVSLVAHMSMFYLYKFYPVGQVMPFYSLFPIFGIIQTFFIFGEIPPLLTLIGGTIVLTTVYYMQKMR
ncbi:DMT family transporter [Candidatus Pelagibacter sp.]|nr:DMT family transporter [Candidatus Pelagibacter sp.]